MYEVIWNVMPELSLKMFWVLTAIIFVFGLITILLALASARGGRSQEEDESQEEQKRMIAREEKRKREIA